MKEELIGKAFEELSFEEMEIEQGASIEARTGLSCASITLAGSFLFSIWVCN